MRIIAGTLKGQTFDSPRGHRTHPMSDKVRGALFNMLGDITDLSMLDAFSGSGALAFEAISRGASHVVAIDADRQAQQAIASNIKTLDLDKQVKLIKASANAWLATTSETFDIILADPPYDDTQLNLLIKLTGRVKKDGLFVLSWPGSTSLPAFEKLTLLADKSYGDAQLGFYRQTA